MKIGIVPNSPDYSHPCDRRRYLPYLKSKNLEFETAKFQQKYDILYVSLACDLNKWAEYKNTHGENTRIIFDLVDNYMDQGFLESALRSIGHFVLRRTKVLRLDYRKTILKMMSITDVVTVGSEEQKTHLSKYHKNIRIVRDYFWDDLPRNFNNQKLKSSKRLTFCWEGFTNGRLTVFKSIKQILNEFSKENDVDVKLIIISNPTYHLFFGKIIGKSTEAAIEKIFKNVKIDVEFLDWTIPNLNYMMQTSDIALIPMLQDKMFQSKPENKLLSFWTAGLPVITGVSPSYTRVMKVSGNREFVCEDFKDWRRCINNLQIKENRIAYLNNASVYVANFSSKNLIFEQWEMIFDEIR